MSVHAELDVGRGDFRLAASFDVDDGQVVALLGPNGSGKTTALHALAGLLALDAGVIEVGGEVLDRPDANVFVPPHQRSVSLVFQDYLLFPHLTAADNVAFGLRAAGVPRATARRHAADLLERFDLAEKAGSKPRELSGGQAQRVALARALATAPELLLLDEPLAALDAGTRATVRRDLRHHLAEFGGATILVTHDPLDALALASSVVVVDHGTITQVGPIKELTAHPRSRYVADLVGLNLVEGRAEGTTITVPSGASITAADAAAGDVFALIHPHAIAVHTSEPTGSPRNHWSGRVEGFDLLGDRVRVRVAGPMPLTAEVTAGAVSELGLHEGQDVWIAVKATEVVIYPR